MQQFRVSGLKTASIPLENPEGVRGERQPGAGSDNEEAEGEDTKWADGGKRFGDKGEARV